MGSGRPNSVASPRSVNRLLALAPGLTITATLTVVDILAGPPINVIGIIVLAPLLTAIIGTPRDVMTVGTVAVALVVLSGLWNDNFDELAYYQRILVVGAGSALAFVAARGRAQVHRDRERFALLAAIAEIADGTRPLQDTVERLNDLVVPTLADICIVDAISRGQLERLAARAAGADGERVATWLLARPPRTGDDPADPERPRLVERISDELLEKISTDAEDLALLRSLGATSFIVVPLRARGRRIGSLTLIVTTRLRRSYGAEDLAFAKVLAGRAALALDNAGLFSELETIEAQLTAALSTLAEAVTVQHAEGALIYANEAAARMMGFDSPAELLATPVQKIVERFETTKADGSPLRLDDLPGRRVLAGLEPTPLVTRSIDRATGEESWRVTKASGVYDRDGKVKLVVNVIEDITEVKRAELMQRVLASAGELLSSSLDYETTLQQVAELAVPQLADWCMVSMPDGRGFIRTVAVAHVDPAKVAFARRIGERYPTPADADTGSAQVIRDGVSQVINDVTDEMLVAMARDDEHLALLRSVGMHAALVVPMSAAGENVGALGLLTSETPRRFSAADVELAEELARRAGTAVEHARLYTERTHIARTLQTGLLPGRIPDIPGWRIATLYRPAGVENWVGGDFYDAFPVRGGWMALVGDVAGRGAEAAALTGLARHTLRTAAQLLDDPLAAIGTLNDELLLREPMSLCSVAAVVLREIDVGAAEDAGATAEIVCAGHPLALLVRDDVVRPAGCFSPMLGADPAPRWERSTVRVRPGDVMVLYTDGVFDAVGESERFGEDRLRRTIAGARDAGEAVARIDRALSAFEVGPQADDTAVLAVARAAVVAPGTAVRGAAGSDERRP